MVDVPGSLGWVDVDRNSEEVRSLRERLSEKNGLHGVDICGPEEVQRATRLFYRDGFVCVRDALTQEQLDYLRKGCAREVQHTLALDNDAAGNRGSHRYSFGCTTTGHQLHNPEWAMLVDLPTVTPILTSIFGTHDYYVGGARGDFCLPGAIEYQPLHSDVKDRVDFSDRASGTRRSVFSFKDPRGMLTYSDLPCFYLACNFLMSDFTKLNGPIRQIPGTQHSREAPPGRSTEPDWMKYSTLCPLPAGSVLIRDVRAWHGGTPNVSDEVRCIPNVEFFAPWYLDETHVQRCMPQEIYRTLSPHGKRLARHVAVAEGKELSVTYTTSSVNPGFSPFSATGLSKM